MLKLNRRVAAIKSSATLAADARATELKAAGVDVIPLAAGEPDFDTPERIKEAARRALAAGKTKYTPVAGTRELKDAIRLKLKRDNHLDYEPAEIMASAGSKPAEYNLIASLFDEGDEVIVPTPAWVSFVAMVQLSGAEPKLVACPESVGFLLDPGAAAQARSRPRTRGIMLNSPSNPTGAVYQRGATRRDRARAGGVSRSVGDVGRRLRAYRLRRARPAHLRDRAAPQAARARVQHAVEGLRDDRMAHRVRRRTARGDRARRRVCKARTAAIPIRSRRPPRSRR